MSTQKFKRNWRDQWYRIVFHADTPEGRLFDVVLLILIVLSVMVVIFDSVPSFREKFKLEFNLLEWCFTIIFSVEYIFRIIISRKPRKYILSFYGIIDFISVIPTYVSILLAGSHYLSVIRILRMLRIFRILKLTRFMKASHVLVVSLKQSRYKIIVFFEVLITTVVIMGSLMYVIEGPENGFTSIPTSIYWAIITLTTVGFGDITPSTPLGQFLASFIMILGYSIIAVPTGIISAEIVKAGNKPDRPTKCSECHSVSHDEDALYCKYCGKSLTGGE
ncbi:MAG: ion transporter [Bacteroidales bacterium]|nr:ion transporter [Bacteroidales bacterium]